MTKRELEKYLCSNEIDVQSANAAVILADLVFSAYSDSGSAHGVSYSPLFCYFTKTAKNFYQLIPKKLIKTVARRIYTDFSKDKRSLDRRITKHQRLTDKIEKLGIKFSKDKQMCDDELRKYFESLLQLSRAWWHLGAIGEDKGEIINEVVVPNFRSRHKLSANEARSIVNVLAQPDKQSVLSASRTDFIKICLAVARLGNVNYVSRNEHIFRLLSYKKISSLVDSYIQENYWQKTDFCWYTKITAEQLINEVIKELSKRKPEELRLEIKQLKRINIKIKSEKNKILLRLKLENLDYADLDFTAKTVSWFEQRKRGMMIQIYYFFCILEEIARRFNKTKEEITMMEISEVLLMMDGGSRKFNSKKKLGAFVVFEKGRPMQYFYDPTGEKLLSLAKCAKSDQRLLGMVASRAGVALIQGRVSIINNPDSEKFLDGDILVTSMTRIEFVPLMRRAKAIITNEGGIACHAAIISRELGIPCIIGTKHATEVLKSGDDVVMNLETGEIKVIK